jgi:putative molybdopterin biosynthesis protein
MEILSAKELSRYLKINEKKIYQLARESKLPYTKIGGKIAFAKELIDRWITETTEQEHHLYVAGSDDPLFDRIIHDYNTKGPAIIFYAAVGSLNGLRLLKKRAANISCVHIMDVEKKEYNVSYLHRYLDNGEYVVVDMYSRQQGLYLQKGNPKRIQSVEDLGDKNVTFVNRKRGSGTRLLFDFLLHEHDVQPDKIQGYDTEVDSHLDAGLKVLRQEADASFGIQYIAHVLNLHFVPLTKERFDLVMPEEYSYSDQAKMLLAFFEQGRLLPYIKDFVGYDTERSGSVLTGHG